MAATLPDIAKVETAIVEATNAFRAEHKLAAVKPEPRLARAARAYAEFLASRNLFSHTADGRQPHQRVEAAGYSYCEAAENLAMHKDSRGFESRTLAVKAVEGWINSPGHRRNLLASGVTDIGVAVAKAPDEHPKYIAVQVFGRPRSLAVEFQIANATDGAIGYTFSGKTHDLKPHVAATHTACSAGEISFSKPGGLLSSATPLGRYPAADGALFTVRADDKGRITIDAGKREKVKVTQPAAKAAPPSGAAPRASAAREGKAPASRESSR